MGYRCVNAIVVRVQDVNANSCEIINTRNECPWLKGYANAYPRGDTVSTGHFCSKNVLRTCPKISSAG